MLYAMRGFEVRPLSRLFRALGDDTRVRMVALLSHGELCVCHIEEALGLSQPTASRHLGVLRAAGVVDKRRERTWVYYRIAAQARADVKRVMALLKDSFAHERDLRDAHAAVKRSCGPAAA